jgi:hypothetical protein
MLWLFRVEQDEDQKYFKREATMKKHTRICRCHFYCKDMFPRKVNKQIILVKLSGVPVCNGMHF